jgi:hypothetical protein
MTPGGLTFLSTAGGLLGLAVTHWHAHARNRQERPSGARQARRDQTTSAAAAHLSRKRRDAATASGPRSATRCKASCIRARTRAFCFRAAGAGISFFGDSRKWLEAKGKGVVRNFLYPHFVPSRHCRAFAPLSSWPGLSRPSTSCKLSTWRGLIFFLTNKPDGILYVGVTNDLVRRI